MTGAPRPSAPGCGAHLEGPCATCGDVADPMLVLSRDGGDARVRTRDGGEATVAVDLVPDAGPGTVVLVHQGVAIGTLADVASGRETETTR